MYNRFTPILPGILLVLNWLVESNRAQAQLTVGPNGLFIKGITTVTIDSLVLQPSANLTLSNLSITHTATPVSGTGGNSIRRVYAFSHPIAFTGNIGLFYADNELNGNAEPSLELVYQRGTDGTYITTTGSYVDAGTNYVLQSLSVPAIRRITATSNNVILPIVLRSFDATAAADRVKLEWQTSLEQDLDRFEIERSTDGSNFTLLTTVKGHNNPTGAAYTAWDNDPATGRNFYRLLQYDKNGTVTNAGIRSVLRGGGNMTVTAYPNPAIQSLNLRLQNTVEVQLHVTLYTAQGALVHAETIQLQPDRSNYPLQIKTMPPKGSYYLKVTGEKGFSRVLTINIQ